MTDQAKWDTRSGKSASSKGLSLELIHRVIALLGPRRWTKISALMALTLVASTFEVLGIGIFLPYISVVSDPEALLGHQTYGSILSSLGIVDRNGLILAAGFGLLAVFTLKNAYLAFHWHVVTRLIYREIRRVSTGLFQAYLQSPYLFHLTHNSSRLLRNVAGEAKHVFRDVMEQGVRLIVEALVFVGAVVVLLIVNPAAAAAGLVLMGIVAWCIERIARHRMIRLGERRAEAAAERYQWMQQGLGAVKEIQILGRDNYFVRRFDEWEEVLTGTMRKASLAARYPRLALEMAAVVFLVGVISLPMLAGQDLDALLGVMVVFGVAIIRLLPAASRITAGLNQVRFSSPSVDILYGEFLEAETAAKALRGAKTRTSIRFQEEIVVDRLSYKYPGRDEWAIQDLTLTFRKGESVGFSGESGGGKTTLIYLLTGLLTPGRGRILVDGQDIAGSVPAWQRELGYVSQDTYLLDDTVRRNVAFGLADEEIDDDAVWKALDMAQLAQTVTEIGSGLDVPAGERGVGLSGGQRQRLAIARALYHDPPVLILDEPTSALDPETERSLGRTIANLKNVKTIVMVSHRSETLRNCDVSYVLERGRIVGRESGATTYPHVG